MMKDDEIEFVNSIDFQPLLKDKSVIDPLLISDEYVFVNKDK